MPDKKVVVGKNVVMMVVGRMVVEVRLRHEHAAETTSHAKYTTAAGAVEHDGAGSSDDDKNVVEVGVGVISGVLEDNEELDVAGLDAMVLEALEMLEEVGEDMTDKLLEVEELPELEELLRLVELLELAVSEELEED